MILAWVQAHLCDFGEVLAAEQRSREDLAQVTLPTHKLHLSEQKKRFKVKGNTVVIHYKNSMLG